MSSLRICLDRDIFIVAAIACCEERRYRSLSEVLRVISANLSDETLCAGLGVDSD